MIRTSTVFLVVLLASAVWAAKLGKVSYLEGQAWILSGDKEKAAKVNTQLKVGDKIRTGSESVVEITYLQGTVVRIGENSSIALDGADMANDLKVEKGKLWANVHKMASGDFRVTTGLATAAVRGTVFRVEGEDSSSTVALYEGKVDVGPADTTKIQPKAAAGGWGPPVEVPGPYEVSLEDWIHLDPGKQINVRWGGKYATGDIVDTTDSTWVKFNQKRDELVPRDK